MSVQEKGRRFALIISAALLVASLVWAQADEKVAPPKKSTAATAAKGDPRRGKKAFEEWCEICHYVENTEKKIGPGLKGIYRRGKFADGKKVEDTSMRAWIENGGKDMPSFKDSLTAQQIADLIAYLRTL
jgi:cytochrome c2